jgi:hypothetical protein
MPGFQLSWGFSWLSSASPCECWYRTFKQATTASLHPLIIHDHLPCYGVTSGSIQPLATPPVMSAASRPGFDPTAATACSHVAYPAASTTCKLRDGRGRLRKYSAVGSMASLWTLGNATNGRRSIEVKHLPPCTHTTLQ